MSTSPQKSNAARPTLAAPNKALTSSRRSSGRSPVSPEMRRSSAELSDSFSALSMHKPQPPSPSAATKDDELYNLFTMQAPALIVLASIQSVSPTDPSVWPTLLLGAKYIAPFSSQDATKMEAATINVAMDLAANNASTNNFGKLIMHLLSQLFLLKETLKGPNTALLPISTYNALFLTRVFAKHFAANSTNEELINLFEWRPSSPKHQEQLPINTLPEAEKLLILPQVVNEDRSRIEQLLDALLSLLTNLDINANYPIYEFYVEILNTLLVLSSTQLYHSRVLGSNCFMDCVMQKFSNRADTIVAKLLENVTLQSLPPVQSSSVVVNAYNYFFSPKAGTFDSDLSPVADRSLLFMLLLCSQPKQMGERREIWGDAYRTAITYLRDHNVLAMDLDGGDQKMHLIPFKKLFEIFCQSLDVEEKMLLFYFLLAENNSFRVYVLSRTDPETIYVPMLKMIYESADAKTNYCQVYIMLTILLILSQDEVNNETMQKITVHNMTWFAERPLLKSISLGGLAVLVFIRILQHNLSHQKDVYLHTLCLAILVNMSSSMSDMNAYVAQRIISLFDLLSRRLLKLTTKSQAHGTEMDMAAYEDVLVLALEMINSVLSQRLKYNSQLVYALLQKRDLFVAFRDKPRFTELLAKLEPVIDYFNQRVFEANLKSPSTTEVLQIIEQAARKWPTADLETNQTPLKFQYVEQPDAHEFFVPYVWALIQRRTFTGWDESKTHILDAYRQLSAEGE